MPARLITEAGVAPGTAQPIEQEVVLLGRDGTIGLKQEELLTGHAATLEYRDRKYRVYNKQTTPIRVEKQTVPQRGAAEWKAGERLYLSDNVILRLDIQGDPAPAKATGPVLRADDVVSDVKEETNRKDEKKKSSKKNQVVVIVLCLLLVVLSFFAPKDEESAGAGGATTADLEKIMTELRNEEGEADMDTLWRILREAQFEEARGMYVEANRKYRRVALLVRQRYGEELAGASKATKDADAFCRAKLTD